MEINPPSLLPTLGQHFEPAGGQQVRTLQTGGRYLYHQSLFSCIGLQVSERPWFVILFSWPAKAQETTSDSFFFRSEPNQYLVVTLICIFFWKDRAFFECVRLELLQQRIWPGISDVFSTEVCWRAFNSVPIACWLRRSRSRCKSVSAPSRFFSNLWSSRVSCTRGPRTARIRTIFAFTSCRCSPPSTKLFLCRAKSLFPLR